MSNFFLLRKRRDRFYALCDVLYGTLQDSFESLQRNLAGPIQGWGLDRHIHNGRHHGARRGTGVQNKPHGCAQLVDHLGRRQRRGSTGKIGARGGKRSA